MKVIPQELIQVLTSNLGRCCDCGEPLYSHSELEPFPCLSCPCTGYVEGDECPPDVAELAGLVRTLARQYAPLLRAMGVAVPAYLLEPAASVVAPAAARVRRRVGWRPGKVAPHPALVPVAYAIPGNQAHAHPWRKTEPRGQALNFEHWVCDVCAAFVDRSTVADFLIYNSPRTRREVYVWIEDKA